MVVATVCLLETSRHGLLETELLQMLAEESTLTPPPYVEGESDQITVTKAETTEAGLLSLKKARFLMINSLTAPFNNMRTLKFQAQPTNASFATVNQMFGGSSKLPTSAESAVIESNR